MIRKVRIIAAGFCVALVANIAHGAVEYPYTKTITYPYGLQSAKFTDATFQDWYNNIHPVS